MKNRGRLIFLVSLTLLAAAFLLLNFHAAVSNTRVESNSGTASIGDEQPSAMQRRDPVTIAVIGEGPLVRSLQNTIEAEMRAAGIGDVDLVPELAAAYRNPVMQINVGEPGVIWTPFYATSQFSVQVGYASNGETGSLSGAPSVLSNENGPVLNLTAEFKIADRSWGILSRPGYYQVLAEALAHKIGETMKAIYFPS